MFSDKGLKCSSEGMNDRSMRKEGGIKGCFGGMNGFGSGGSFWKVSFQRKGFRLDIRVCSYKSCESGWLSHCLILQQWCNHFFVVVRSPVHHPLH